MRPHDPPAPCRQPSLQAAALLLPLALLLAAAAGSQAQVVEEPPYLPACASNSLNDFRENFASRGVSFDLSNLGKYVYEVSVGKPNKNLL